MCHTIETCFKNHGFPHGSKPKGKQFCCEDCEEKVDSRNHYEDDVSLARNGEKDRAKRASLVILNAGL